MYSDQLYTLQLLDLHDAEIKKKDKLKEIIL